MERGRNRTKVAKNLTLKAQKNVIISQNMAVSVYTNADRAQE
jgi:hypothetical protein